MKVSILYSTRVRKSDIAEIRMEHNSGASKFIKDITMTKTFYNGSKDVTIEEYSSKIYVLLFNFYMLTKNDKKANELLDKLLLKAEMMWLK